MPTFASKPVLPEPEALVTEALVCPSLRPLADLLTAAVVVATFTSQRIWQVKIILGIQVDE